MAERISSTLIRDDDGQLWKAEEGTDNYARFDGEVEEDTTSTDTPSDTTSPSGGDIALGISAEISIAGAASMLVARAGLPGYIIGNFAGGALGSYTSQQIEKREDLSYGRMVAAGLTNLIPFGGAAKPITGSTKITGELIKRSAAKEAKRGAAIGVVEANIISAVDNGEMADPLDMALYGLGGATFGGLLGAAAPNLTKAISKQTGKSVDEVDESLARMTQEDAVREVREGTAMSEEEATKIYQAAVQKTASKQAIETLEQANSNNVSWWQKTVRTFRPSKIIGQEANEAKFYNTAGLRSVQEKGGRLASSIQAAVKKDPSIEKDINTFLDGGELSPRIKGTALEGDLNAFNKTKGELTEKLIEQLETKAFKSMKRPDQVKLLRLIKKSKNKGYVTREYKAFTDDSFEFDNRLYPAALAELTESYRTSLVRKAQKAEVKRDKGRFAGGRKPKKLSLAKQKLKDKKIQIEAKKLAVEKLEGYRSTTAKYRAGAKGSAGSDLSKSMKDVGVAQRRYLGEIVDAGERVRGTLTKLSSNVYRTQKDIQTLNGLQKAGLAITVPQGSNSPIPQSMSYQKLDLDNIETPDVYVPNEVQFALEKLNDETKSGKSNGFVTTVLDALDASIGTGKAVKVVLNPPSYAVNYFGGVITMLGSGINPFKRSYFKGAKLAAGQFDNVGRYISGGTAKGRKQFLDDVEEMAKYGISNANIIASDIRSNTLNDGYLSNKVKKVFGGFGKAYSVTDTAARYAVWRTNQDTLSSVFPHLKGDDLKLAAARLTNDTFQNYDKLNTSLRSASRYGVMPQFVSFTAELMRNVYNNAKFGMQMANGTFGRDIGVDVAKGFNINKMRVEGATRLAATAGIIAGGEGIRRSWNESEGVTEAEEKAYRETFVPHWDKNKSLIFNKDSKGNVSYLNMSYISPHAMAAEAWNAAVSDKPLENLTSVVSDNFVGEGAFPIRAAFSALSGRTTSGANISNEDKGILIAKDKLNFFISESFKPGFARELDKVINTMDAKEPDYEMGDLVLRQAGLRFNKIDVERSATFAIRESASNAQQVQSKYNRLVESEDATPQQVQSAYAEANRIRKDNLSKVRTHYQSLITLGESQESAFKIMKDAGVKTKDILSVDKNTYLPMETDPKKSVAENYDEMFTDKSRKFITAEISRIFKNDPRLAKQLKREFISRIKEERMDLSERELLIKRLSFEDQLAYLRMYPEEYDGLRKARALKSSVVREYKRR